jgi:hypothetical protein
MAENLPAKRQRRSRDTSEAARLRRAILKVLPPVLQRLYQMALGGDVQAAKLLLERALPPLSPVRDAVVLQGESPAEWRAELLEAVVSGNIAPREALAVLELLERMPTSAPPGMRIDPDKLQQVTRALYGKE